MSGSCRRSMQRLLLSRFVEVIGAKQFLGRCFSNKRTSYFHRPGKQPLMYRTVGQIFDEVSDKYADRTALVSCHQGERLTFSQLKDKAEMFASGLVSLGISRGDRVGLWGPNSTQWYVANLALAKCGAISVYLNPAYQASEVMHSLNHVGTKMLIMAETFKTQNYYKILSEIAPEVEKSQPGRVKSQALPSLESVIIMSDEEYPGTFRYKDVNHFITESSKTKLKDIEISIAVEDACNIQFTSGTTGRPKGAALSHFAIVNNSYLIGRGQDFHLKEHRFCLSGPFFHAMGSVIAVLTCLQHGVTLVVPDFSFNPAKCVEAVTKEKCTAIVGTPTMYVDILHLLSEKNLRLTTLEVAISGGALCPPELYRKMLNQLGVKRVASVYGLTESGPVAFMSKSTDNVERMTSTVGYIMEHTEAKVVDANGVVVPVNTPGELWLRGCLLMNGYWNDEEKTKKAITTYHWLKTGDQFIIDEEGYGKVTGRIKDLIIRGGENISPLDVEEFLANHPDVMEVQVFGIPDERLGEQVCACLHLKPGSKLTKSELQEYCRGKISHFKIPYYVHFFDEFPRTASGKIMRFKLKEKVLKLLEKNN